MTETSNFLEDFHWLMDVLQDIDVGLVILSREFRVELWNGFMQNHSARMPDEVLGMRIFDLFPELPENWFRRKAEAVFVLENAAFTTWEQRPYLFRFKSYRPITSMAEFMYQNSTIIPLTDTRGNVDHICLIIYDVTEVAVSRLQLQKTNAQLHQLSRTDGLTGLLNRKAWETEAIKEFQRYQRHHRHASLVMLDIDHFKKVNDNYGHPTGDEVIRRTAKLILETSREIDIAGRYGGEEFALVLVDTDAIGAEAVAERLRQKISQQLVQHDGKQLQYTISLGIAQLSDRMATTDDWIDGADKALYLAKHKGRNQTIVFSD